MIEEMKREAGKDILAHGGAAFARSLVAGKLVDEYRLLVHPVALGGGLALFADLAAPAGFKLVSSTPFEAGTIANIYQPTVGAS